MMQLNTPKIMGIINLSRDSFYESCDQDSSIELAKTMLKQGADIIDLGAESTRPGAKAVSAAKQLTSLLPVITALRKFYTGIISVDTSEPEVMAASIAAGVNMINDVRALKYPGALEIAAKHNIPVCLTHMQGETSNMQHNPIYPRGVVTEIIAWCDKTYKKCIARGIKPNNIILDPGFGFGKTISDNWQLLWNLQKISQNYPIAVGVSNKSMFKTIPGCEAVTKRKLPSNIAEAFAITKFAKIIRTHNVAATAQAIATANMLLNEGNYVWY